MTRYRLTSNLISLLIISVIGYSALNTRFKPDKTKCPNVKSYKSFDFRQILGPWYVVEYYASSEESIIYRCMRTQFTISDEDIEISMNFTYSFIDDPDNEQLQGNITWRIPDMNTPGHWVHSEDTYEGVYNTYVLDIDIDDNKSWVLLLHCAEKSGSTPYLSSFIMARQHSLPVNVLSFLRDKLPRYDIDLQYMFEMDQNNCILQNQSIFSFFKTNTLKHPMNHAH